MPPVTFVNFRALRPRSAIFSLTLMLPACEAKPPPDRAEELRREAGRVDVSFEHKDLRSIDRASGEFDYIIAHGIHSWVEPDVQAGLIAAIASVLSPSGVAYVSHNVYPGSYLRRMAREAMLQHAPLFMPPPARLRASRAMLERATRDARTARGRAAGQAPAAAQFLRR